MIQRESKEAAVTVKNEIAANHSSGLCLQFAAAAGSCICSIFHLPLLQVA